MRILITGTPGTGKTCIGLELSRRLNYEYINLNEILVRSGVCKYNPDIDTHEIADTDRAIEIIDSVLSRDDIVVDTLVISLIKPEDIDKVVVLRLNPKILLERLRLRGWRGRKLCENVLAEILDYFLVESINIFGEDKVIEIDTSNKSINEVVNEIIKLLSSSRPRLGAVSWLSSVDSDFLVKLDMCREGLIDDV